uniref:NADH-ubiquinone oxidoreductase chain 1 n=1 Tax=Ptiliidae sp. BMNH 1274724 TaxID=1796537 RepID=A0A126TEH1_9COLE|nr:NADH dehydrogenase subunit 1 [Ptiliidae sp. BMNH 1274724]
MSLYLSMIFLLISVLVSVAFLTLLERKVLGYIQIRKGPNKVGFIGILQPFSDALKLISKEFIMPIYSNYFLYYISPIFNMWFSLMLWMIYPFFSFSISFKLSILFFFCVSSMSVYSVMLSGWSSNSNYSLLGSIRAIAQTISYEVSLIMILLSSMFLTLSLNISNFLNYQYYMSLFYLLFPIFLMWIVSCLAETNRTPFDFAEGESELVSGFNIEYSSGGFVLIFLAEYSSILFMSMLTVIMFFGSGYYFLLFMKLVLISFCWLWIRGTFPRYRYDKLMNLAWKVYLPLSMFFIMFFYGLKLYVLVLLS